MLTSFTPLSTPRIDRTADTAIERADTMVSGYTRLEVSIEERCGERLLLAFLATANARFTGRDASGGTAS